MSKTQYPAGWWTRQKRTKSNRYYFLIERNHLERQSVSSVLDMLRYDDVRVENNAPPGYWLFSAPHAPTIARWKSFGICIAADGSDLDAVLRHIEPRQDF